MWIRKELKSRAKQILKINYWKAFLVSLVIAMVSGSDGGYSYNFNSTTGNAQNNQFNGISQVSGTEMWGSLMVVVAGVLLIALLVLAFRILLGYPLEVGGRRYFVRAAQQSFDMSALSFGFEKPKYMNIVKAMLWRGFINFLWFLVLIIPGIVKSYAYRMVPYILADNPDIGYERALELSDQMTDGEKFDMFVLDISFIGWYFLGYLAFVLANSVGGEILGVLAGSVVALLVSPYINATKAELYLVLRNNALDRGFCAPEELMLT